MLFLVGGGGGSGERLTLMLSGKCDLTHVDVNVSVIQWQNVIDG